MKDKTKKELKDFGNNLLNNLPNITVSVFIMFTSIAIFGSQIAVLGVLLLFFQIMYSQTSFSKMKFVKSVIAIILIIIGIIILLYPKISNYIEQKNQIEFIKEYKENISKMESTTKDKEYLKAEKYNEYLKQKEKEKEKERELQKQKEKEQEKGINKDLNKFTYKDFIAKIKEKLGVEVAAAFAENLKANKISQDQQINQNKLKELITQTEKQLNLKKQELEKLAEQEKMLQNEKEKGVDKNKEKEKDLEKEKLKDSLKNTFNKDKKQEQEKANEQKARTSSTIAELEAKYGRDLDGDGFVNDEVAVGKQKYDPEFTKSVEKHENLDIDGGGIGKNPNHLLKNRGRSIS